MLFFYNNSGDKMKIYIDYVLFINFVFDLLLLLGVSTILKRNTSINRIIIGAFFGSLTILLLFIKINNLELFLFKFIISVLMIIISFGYKNIKYFFKNLLFLYILGFILGGVLYGINNQFSYKNVGLIFINKGISINIIFILIISPIIIYFYTKEMKNLKNNYNNYYKIIINLENKEYKFIGFLDTGNKLKDPYFNRPIILLKKDKIDIKNSKKILIPYQTITENGLLECAKIDKIYIENVGIRKNILLGFIKDNITIDGVDCIIQEKLLEG